MARTIAWKAAVWAGIIAGLVFMVLEMLLVQLVGAGSMWGPPRMDGRDRDRPGGPAAAGHL
jgi:hypothetical protein